VLIIACGALAREIIDLIKINNWHHMDLTCLPAKYHLYPEKITTAVELAVKKTYFEIQKYFYCIRGLWHWWIVRKKM